MLGSMAAILNSALEGGLIFVLIMLSLKKAGFKTYNYPFYLGIACSVISSLMIVYFFDFFGDREVFDGYLAFGTSFAAVVFWFWGRFHIRKGHGNSFDTKKNMTFIEGSLVFLIAWTLILGKLNEVVLLPSTFLLMSSSLLNSELLLKTAGVFLGLLFTGLFIFIFLRNSERISGRMYLNFSTAVLLVVVIRQLIMGLQVLFATGVLPLTTWAVEIIAPLINNYYPGFFYVLIGFTFVLWGLGSKYLAENSPDIATAVNPAQKRKVFSAFNRERRWLRAMGIMLLTACMILAGNAVLANREIKMEPPTPISADGGKILIPLEQVKDGKLHRFSYITAQNIETRFVIIKKGEGLYGTGLDACDICGNAGYYQRGKEVVCKNCDVVINIPTIGFPGGCNPIPLKNKIIGQKLVISAGDLDAKQDIFQE